MDAPDPMNEPSKFATFPRYRSHKVVQAVRIAHLMLLRDAEPAGALIQPAAAPGFESPSPFTVDQAFLDKHQPRVGGYIVVYDGGAYVSFSPAAPFEAGYSRLEQ